MQVDTYIDVELPYPDAKVAAALCIGGACKYVIKESNGVSDSWLLQYVVPNICTEYARDVALVLAPPLLWAVFEPTLQGYLPQSLMRRIKAAYEIICPLQQNIDNNNPVERRLIVRKFIGYKESVYEFNTQWAQIEAPVAGQKVFFISQSNQRVELGQFLRLEQQLPLISSVRTYLG